MTSVGKTSQVSARIKIINREPTLRLSWITVLNRPPPPKSDESSFPIQGVSGWGLMTVAGRQVRHALISRQVWGGPGLLACLQRSLAFCWPFSCTRLRTYTHTHTERFYITRFKPCQELPAVIALQNAKVLDRTDIILFKLFLEPHRTWSQTCEIYMFLVQH